jgi:two-component system, cell cycle response regulator DivK
MNTKLKKLLIGKNILIVEDDSVSSEFLKEILSDFQANLIFTRTAEESISVCMKNKDIDMVLMDIRLPDKSGYEATREIKKSRPELLIIAQTAYALEGDRDNALNAGCDYYISKPIKAIELFNLIEKALS